MPLPTVKSLVAVLALTLAAGVACAGELTVSAASSLTNAFKDIAHSYEARNPDSKVALNFGASGALLLQIAKGAPVDVFAAADQETMDAAEKGGFVAVGSRQNFLGNRLVLITPVDAKQPINQLNDLLLPTVQKIAIGNPASVPVGRYAQHALEAASLWAKVSGKAINTENVRQSLDYVARGEVDAAFVYTTDAMIMPDKVKTALTVPLDIEISYPIATMTGSANAAEAGRFIDFVLSQDGQSILAKYGFLKP
jgi:molybdate transport system substrate-binding protein